MKLRHKANGDLYQIIISKQAREIRVIKPKLQANCEGAINYEWPEEATYENLNVAIIAASVERAETINKNKMYEQLGYVQKIEEQESSQNGGDTSMPLEESTKENDGNVVLTEEEMELIYEFLKV